MMEAVGEAQKRSWSGQDGTARAGKAQKHGEGWESTETWGGLGKHGGRETIKEAQWHESDQRGTVTEGVMETRKRMKAMMWGTGHRSGHRDTEQIKEAVIETWKRSGSIELQK